MAISLTPAVQSDLAFLVRLRQQTMQTYLTQAKMPCLRKDHISRVLYEFDATQIIWVDGHQVGMVKCKRQKDHWHLIQLQVLPQHQNQGIASQILNTLKQQAHQEQCDAVLSVIKTTPAKRLYQRLGFKVESQDRHQYHLRYSPS